MEMEGPMILGMNLWIAIMLAAGVFYLLCAILIWKPFRQEKNELVGALFAFFVYQAISMFFMGIEMHTMNMAYGTVATLAVLVGSAYMLKFPFSFFSQGVRKLLFMASMIAVLVLFGWFMSSPERQEQMMNFTLWYDIVVNGIVVGLFMFIVGLRATQPWLRTKAMGGGAGVVSCCVVANVTMLGSAFLASSIFQFLAPVLILWAIIVGRRKQNALSQNRF